MSDNQGRDESEGGHQDDPELEYLQQLASSLPGHVRT